MKSNKIMKRQMGEYEVLQRTSDSYFDINALVNQWNSNPLNKRRRLDDFLNSKNTKEFIATLENTLAQGEISPMAKNEIIKKHGGSNTSNGREKNEIWVHPFLFIKAAMWVNPRFEVEVIKYVYDNLISLRCDAGDNYGRKRESTHLIVVELNR